VNIEVSLFTGRAVQSSGRGTSLEEVPYRAPFLVLQDGRVRFEPNTPMAAFAETGIVLKAKAAVAGQPLQLPQELASLHDLSIAQICAKGNAFLRSRRRTSWWAPA
jgi:hypothetical protein